MSLIEATRSQGRIRRLAGSGLDFRTGKEFVACVPCRGQFFAGEQNGAFDQTAEFLFRDPMTDTRLGDEIRYDFIFHREPLKAGDPDVLLVEFPGLALLQFHLSFVQAPAAARSRSPPAGNTALYRFPAEFAGWFRIAASFQPAPPLSVAGRAPAGREMRRFHECTDDHLELIFHVTTSTPAGNIR